MGDSSSTSFAVGQRWRSETEPELGLGIISAVAPRLVSVLFRATDERRQYAADNAPLRRVRFQPGDTISTATQSFIVTGVGAQNGLLTYVTKEGEIPETSLSDTIASDQPGERLARCEVDPNEVFDLRLDTLQVQQRIRKLAVRGFLGARIALLPHQLYIAQEVARRELPRVLLADEVGLGKTIEACLILHRLLLTGRAVRVLILVPESLIHQWFVELFRRFNLRFSLFDEERCVALEPNQPNPFLDDQLVIADIAWLAGNDSRRRQVVAAGWDALVVDEAHHLVWDPQQSSPSYQLVEALSAITPAVLLLTATPAQLGLSGHFARLRLLDPDRYQDWNQFLAEASHYENTARAATRLLERKPIRPADRQLLKSLFTEEQTDLEPTFAAIASGDETARDRLITDLLDRHGTGRVMFRNTRAGMTGFPARRAHLVELQPAEPDLAQTRQEFKADLQPTPINDGHVLDLTRDVRVAWLAGLLRELRDQKILLICRTRQKVRAIEESLRQRINVKIGLFHEELTLLQRDRAAAWFAEEDGAQILLCSEIGSEGRNFQFAHHLVLFDLPLDPELLEQRIGRLDRIGQTATIHLHVPFLRDSPQAALARWYDEGLNAFEVSLEGGYEVFLQFQVEVAALGETGSTPEIAALIAKTKTFHATLVARLAQGRDRLLELNSFRAPLAQQVIEEISTLDRDPSLEAFVLAIFDHLGIRMEELSRRTYMMGAGDLIKDAFPALPAEGMTVTCDRAKALSREDIGFLSWDHPIVTGAIDLTLGSEQGTTACAAWETNGPPAFLLEAAFVLECLAPAALQADQFLPPTVIRVVIDHQSRDVSAEFPSTRWRDKLQDAPVHAVVSPIAESLLPDMLAAAHDAAATHVNVIVQNSLKGAVDKLQPEIQRLAALHRVNPNVSQQEVSLAEERLRNLQGHLQGARLRLDAVRLIMKRAAVPGKSGPGKGG